MSRYAVTLLGATGATGRNAIPYLAERAHELGVRWAIAGRRPQKLHQLLAGIDVERQPEVLEADIEDPDSLAEMAAASDVVINAVGPYRWSAGPVIDACIAGGSHYLDMAGETDVIAEMLTRDEAARAAGVRIVQAAGYEALPFDIAVALAQRRAEDRGTQLASVDVALSVELPPGLPRPSDGVSGGTLGSMVAALREGSLVRLTDPAALLPQDEAAAVRSASPLAALPPVVGRKVLAPMVPSPFTNPAIVLRSQSLLRREGAGAPTSMRYREGLALADGLLTMPAQAALAAPLTAAAASTQLIAKLTPSPVRRGLAGLLELLGPEAGSGPDPDRLEGWRWTLDVRATGADGHTDVLVVDADGHPGYLATARIISEAALILADEDADVPDRTGHLTPALALGTAELDRFARAGVRFT